MTTEIEYTIPEEFQMMAALAGPLALRLFQRLHGKPDCHDFDEHAAIDCPDFINEKLGDMQEYVPEVTFAINQLPGCTSEYEIENALEDLEAALRHILDSMDEVKCARFDGAEEAKPLLLAAMSRVVQDTALMLQTLHQAVMNPEQFSNGTEGNVVIDLSIEFRVDEEMAAIEAWANRQSRASRDGWGTLLTVFGLGWWLGND